MNKNIGSLALLAIITSLLLVNVLSPPLFAFGFLESNVDPITTYLQIIGVYLSLIVLVYFEPQKIKIYNIDKGTIILLALVGFIRIWLHFPYEEYYRNICFLLGMILLAVSLANWKHIANINWRWAFIGILSSSIVIPFSFLQYVSFDKALIPDLNQLHINNLTVYYLRNVFYEISIVAPVEEIIFRSLLWGALIEMGISEKRTVYIQGVLFWFMHGWQNITPITWLISISLSAILFSQLTKNSKQVFPSIISHSLINFMFPIVARVILGI